MQTVKRKNTMTTVIWSPHQADVGDVKSNSTVWCCEGFTTKIKAEILLGTCLEYGDTVRPAASIYYEPLSNILYLVQPEWNTIGRKAIHVSTVTLILLLSS